MTVIQEKIQALKENARYLSEKAQGIDGLKAIKNAIIRDMQTIQESLCPFNYHKLSSLFKRNYEIYLEIQTRPQAEG